MSWEAWLVREVALFEDTNTTEEKLKKMAEHLGIITKSRKREIILKRYCYWEWVRKKTDFALERIGRLTGGHDHATVLHGIRELRSKLYIKDALMVQALKDFEILVERYEKRNRI